MLASNKRVRTLATGGGANDVAMIQSVHACVGYLASTGYANCKLKLTIQLSRFVSNEVIYHHGRLKYKRMKDLFWYMFYNNFVVVIVQCLDRICTGQSGLKFYGDELATLLCNICYNSLPIIECYVFEYDVPLQVIRFFLTCIW